MLKAPFIIFDGYLVGHERRVEPWGGSSRWQIDTTGYELFMLLWIAWTIHTRLRKTIPGAQKGWLIISPKQTPSPERWLVFDLVCWSPIGECDARVAPPIGGPSSWVSVLSVVFVAKGSEMNPSALIKDDPFLTFTPATGEVVST